MYGFLLGREDGDTVCYVGATVDANLRLEYLQALEPDGGVEHRSWGDVPQQLRRCFADGYVYRGEEVVILEDVPAALETSLGLSLEAVYGVGKVYGGVSALRQTPVVRDCLTLLRLHDAGRCVECGLSGHRAGAPACGVDSMSENALPFLAQRAERRREALEKKLQECQTALEAATPLKLALPISSRPRPSSDKTTSQATTRQPGSSSSGKTTINQAAPEPPPETPAQRWRKYLKAFGYKEQDETEWIGLAAALKELKREGYAVDPLQAKRHARAREKFAALEHSGRPRAAGRR